MFDINSQAYMYKLDEQHNIVPVWDSLEWSRWHSTADRVVGSIRFPFKDSEVRVSTVFLGMVHCWKLGVERKEPALFETMVFGPDEVIAHLIEMSELDPRSIISAVFGGADIQERYATWDEAAKGHKQMCDFVEVCLAKLLVEEQTR